MANRAFIFHQTNTRFSAFQFNGTAETSENWQPGFTTLRGAAADYSRIVVLDASGSTAVARFFNAAQTRQAASDITMNSTDDYRGLALTPTHLVALNRTNNKLEYYQLSDGSYDSSNDVVLPSTSTGFYDAICRAGDHLFVLRRGSNAADKRIFKRTLDGTAVSDWATLAAANHDTVFASRDMIFAVRRGSGDWDSYDFDGTVGSIIPSVGAGTWAASYSTFDLATVAFSTPVQLSNGDFQLNITWAGGDTGFTQDDLSLNHGTIANFFSTGTPNVYQAEITPPSAGAGTIILSVREDAVTEKNAAATFTVGTFNNKVMLSLSLPETGESGEAVTLRITSPVTVTGLTLSDLDATAGTLSNLQEVTPGREWTATLTLPSGSGTATVTLPADSVSPANNAVSAQIAYTPPPTATTLSRTSGNDQTAETGETLSNPFVVRVLDQNGDPFQGAVVTFAITGGTGASLSTTSDTTDSNGQAQTTLTLGATPGSYIVTASVTGITGNVQFSATAQDPNQPASVTLSVPAQGSPGQTVNISAVVTGISNPQGEWSASGGTIADDGNASTTLTLPDTVGVVAVSYDVTGADEVTASKTAYITVGDPKANIFTPAVRVEIEGVDVTDRLTRDAQGRWEPITIGQSLDYPESRTFRSSGLSFNLDNEDGDFDHSNPNNFFVRHNKPAHGRGAQVLVRLGRSKSELMPAFAGQINGVQTSLQHTKAQIKVVDISVRLRQKAVENFGQVVKRRITDFDLANVDYNDYDPIFYFPILPIVRGSVSVVVHQGDSDIPIEIVDTVATTGTLSNTRAEIDYNRGLIRFEAPPADGADTQITATWKIDYRYKRPDFLVRQLLKENGIQTELGISDDKAARFGIEQALVSHPTDRSFTSHGRPYPAENGVVRWIDRDNSGDTPVWRMVQDQRFLEYDEFQDEYTKIATLPADSGLSGVVPTNYGRYIPGESFDFVDENGDVLRGNPAFASAAYDSDNNRIHVMHGGFIHTYRLDGTLESSSLRLWASATVPWTGAVGYHDGHFYGILISGSSIWLRVFSATTGQRNTSLEWSFRTGQSGFYTINSVNVTADRIYVCTSRSAINFMMFDHSGNRQTAEETLIRNQVSFFPYHAVTANDSHFFVIRNYNLAFHIQAVTRAGVNDDEADIELEGQGDYTLAPRSLFATNTRLYYGDGSGSSVRGKQFQAYELGTLLSFDNYVPYQFTTPNNDDFYFIAANNTQGNAVATSTLRRIKLYKYVKSTDVWTDITIGGPQLSHSHKFPGDDKPTYLADNRKRFESVIRNNKTLLFFRFARAAASGIAYRNDIDGTLTDVYSENHSGAEDFGLPYSMDFALDERSDGIYVYTFVVRYTLETDGDFDSATLKVFRRRMEPSGSQTEIYSETFTGTTAEEDYPVSVSDLILANDRSKFYFVLDWHGEGDRSGKAELCTIAKSGAGSRTVLKTYDNPLVGPRSPAKMGSRYFYLEGGWVRRPKSSTDDDIPDEEHYYPNEGGKLIEIESDNSVTDHGQVWRSATKQDHPDAVDDSPIYDGYGLHNAVISNIEVDERGNLHFVVGHGSPYNVRENLPFTSNREPVPALSNFPWIQWGQDLATKIASFPTGGVRVWQLIQQLAQLMNWEVGFGPGARKVDAIQAAHAGITDWGANASLFFRPRTILPATLRTGISASGTPTQIELNDSGLPAEMAEFPAPPSGERYPVIIDREIFTYTGVTPDAQGRQLTGIARAQNGSVAAAHAVNSGVYFVDYFASGEIGTTLVSITSRTLDFANLRNDVNVSYGDAVYPAKNQQSIDENGEFTFELQNSLLSKYDQAWAELIGDTYLDELSELKDLLQFTLVFSPVLRPGQLVVVYQLDRIRIEFKLFRLLQRQHHIPRWQTGVTAVEIID